MRDYNFFEPFLGLEGRRDPASFPVIPVVLLLALALAAFPLYNWWALGNLSNEVAELDAAIKNNPSYALLSEVNTQQALVNEARSRLSLMRSFDTAMSSAQWLDEAFIDLLFSVFPKDMAIESISIAPGGQIQLSGAATNRPAIAELELNMRSTEKFDNIFISGITPDATGIQAYRFTLSAVAKGVAKNATN